MAPVDPHSFTDSTHPPTTHISLTLYLDFSSSTIHASALFTLQNPHSGPFFLDTRSLSIHSIIDPQTKTPLPFSLSVNDPIKGSLLSVTLSNHASFLVTFTTSPSSSALQWLQPPQTFKKAQPFVYTQCQAIHARSVFPCQDTPAVRIRYSARLNIPEELLAVMATKNPNHKNEHNSTTQMQTNTHTTR